MVGFERSEAERLRLVLGHPLRAVRAPRDRRDAISLLSEAAPGPLDLILVAESVDAEVRLAFLEAVAAREEPVAVVLEVGEEAQDMLPFLDGRLDLGGLRVVRASSGLGERARVVREALAAARERRGWASTRRSEAGVVDADAAHTRLDALLGRLRVDLQPIRDPRGAVFGLEAFVRVKERPSWTPPALFALAESVHRVRDLERAIRLRVAAAARALPQHLHLFVNVHPLSLEDPQLGSGRELLARVPQKVVLELTGQAPLEEFARATERIETLRARGYLIGLDDLGEHGGEVSALLVGRPDFVRLDGWLVRKATAQESARRMLLGLRELAARMEASLIGEGIETDEQLRLVREVGVDLFQGYHLGRPEEFPSLALQPLPTPARAP